MDDSATVREWTTILRRLRIGTVKVNRSKTLRGSTVKAVGLALASYADADGSRIHPGIARLSVELEVEYKTVQEAIRVLRRFGLLRLVAEGYRRGNADTFQLVIPVDLLDRQDIDVRSPAQHGLDVEQVRERHRRRPKSTGSAGPGTSVDNPVENAKVQGPQDPVLAHDRDESTGSAGPRTGEVQGPQDPQVQGPQDPATSHIDLVTTTTSQPQLTVRTELAVGGAALAVEDPILAEEEPPLPEKCTHGFRIRRRSDGALNCALCRRETGDQLAPVIPLRRSA